MKSQKDREKEKKKRKKQLSFELELLKLMKKSVKTAVDMAMDDIFKAWK